MSIFDGIDMSDPCAVWPKLQQALDSLLAGEQVVRAKFGDDEQEFQRVDIGTLQSRIQTLKVECASKSSGLPVRRAITFG